MSKIFSFFIYSLFILFLYCGKGEEEEKGECTQNYECEGKFQLTQCEYAVCESEKCIKKNKDAGTQCDDGNSVTINDKCDGYGKCIGESPACGNGYCEPDKGENCNSCVKDCACQQGQVCTPQGTCCTPNCSGKQCGDDGCGGSCGSCQSGYKCENFQCIKMILCGNNTCDSGETYCNCPQDCSIKCGDGCCSTGETYQNCPQDCKCQPNCTGKECGSDGCGGSCGTCSGGKECVNNKCICVLNKYKECYGNAIYWFDSCGNKGEKVKDCPYGCENAQCKQCQPNCIGKQCGDNGCGGNCGDCQSGYKCENGKCIYQPICGNGTCDSGETYQNCPQDCPCESHYDCGATEICNYETGKCESAFNRVYIVTIQDASLNYTSNSADADYSNPDPYVKLYFPNIDTYKGKTSTKSDTLEPSWWEDFEILVSSSEEEIWFCMYDADPLDFDDPLYYEENYNCKGYSNILAFIKAEEAKLEGNKDINYLNVSIYYKGYCVNKNTPITLDNSSQVPIEQLKVGNTIRAFDFKKNKISNAKIEKILIHNNENYIMNLLKTSEGNEIEITGNHPVFTKEGFKPMHKLNIGEKVFVYNQSTGKLEERTIIAIIKNYSKENIVYNLKTSLGNYFANELLIHNKCLAKGTLIDTPNGKVPVESIKIGQSVYGNINGEKIITKVTHFFVKSTIYNQLPGKILSPNAKVTLNHLLYKNNKIVHAKMLDNYPFVNIYGDVYDLQTEAGNYYADGFLMKSD